MLLKRTITLAKGQYSFLKNHFYPLAIIDRNVLDIDYVIQQGLMQSTKYLQLYSDQSGTRFSSTKRLKLLTRIWLRLRHLNDHIFRHIFLDIFGSKKYK